MTFVIAEIGSNWSSFEGAKDSIQLAKECGADAVKFQLFSHKELYGFDGPKLEGELPRDWVEKLAMKADAAGIEFMCTPFSVDGLKFLNQYVQRHKIASSNLTDGPLLKAANETGKPVILSTGGSSLGDIQQAIQYLNPDLLTLLYCVAAYPCTTHNLFMIDELRKLCGNFSAVGYSDHTTDKFYAPLSAVRNHGATVIEKHVNLVHVEKGPDVPHSLGRHDFKVLVDMIRGKAPAHLITKEERGMIERNNVRCIATQDIAPGQELRLNENFGVHRSLVPDLSGVVGFAAESLIGKVAGVKIAKGQGIHAGFLV